MKILLVDDDELFRGLASKALEKAQHQITVASNGDEAIKAVQNGDEFDLVITDMFMPNKDGMEVIRQIKALRPSVKLIVVSSSGAAEYSSFKIAETIGANGSLQKPFTPAQLLEKVREVTVDEGKNRQPRTGN
jgi:CheY-like chemotaxis protein